MHRFGARLQQEWRSRRARNPRYSLRAFAAFLGVDHSTLSQILRGSRRAPERDIRRWADKIGVDEEEAAVYIAAEALVDEAVSATDSQLRQWTAEAMAIIDEPAHWGILRLCRMEEFRADCRWLAGRIGVTVDEVNIALSRLLRLGLLKTNASGQWMDTTNEPVLTESAFRRVALARNRKTWEIQ